MGPDALGGSTKGTLKTNTTNVSLEKKSTTTTNPPKSGSQREKMLNMDRNLKKENKKKKKNPKKTKTKFSQLKKVENNHKNFLFSTTKTFQFPLGREVFSLPVFSSVLSKNSPGTSPYIFFRLSFESPSLLKKINVQDNQKKGNNIDEKYKKRKP